MKNIDLKARPSVAVYIAVTLDGFIAREDGSLDWLNYEDQNEDYGYHSFMDTVDLLVMGRNTFEKVISFGKWPYNKPVTVLTRSLRNLPDGLAGKVTLTRKAPRELLATLAEKGIRKIYLDGGKTIQSFLNLGLVDEITLTRVPVLLGKGIPLFSSLDKEIPMELKECRSFKNGLVQYHYLTIKTQG